MRPVFVMIIVLLVAMLASWIAYFPCLRIARLKNIVDAPISDRKVQKEPIPVMGGIAIFFGIIVGLCLFKTTISTVGFVSTLGVMTVMLYIGSMDDILDIRPCIKLSVEIVASLLLIYGNRYLICDFQGMFGIDTLPVVPAIILSCAVMIVIINAVNLIDGVDGLSSGFCGFASSCLGLFFFITHDYSNAALAFTCVGALVPFFIHNVFGKKTKMYLGDGGSLMMGALLSSLCLSLLNGKGFKYEPIDFSNFSLISFCMALMSIPCFDAVRVMFERIIRGKSPFSADRLHLHHILFDRGFKPIHITIIMLLLNIIPMLIFLVLWKLNFSVLIQFIAVFFVSSLIVLLPSILIKKR